MTLHPIWNAIQCAGSLVAIFLVIGFIAWMAGIASAVDLLLLLTGVFAGSFLAALFRYAGKAMAQER